MLRGGLQSRQGGDSKESSEGDACRAEERGVCGAARGEGDGGGTGRAGQGVGSGDTSSLVACENESEGRRTPAGWQGKPGGGWRLMAESAARIHLPVGTLS